jgi:hypothetical protein
VKTRGGGGMMTKCVQEVKRCLPSPFSAVCVATLGNGKGKGKG